MPAQTKSNIIFGIGLFVKSADGKKATCIECKQNNKPKYEFELPKSSTKALIVHLGSELHKDFREISPDPGVLFSPPEEIIPAAPTKRKFSLLARMDKIAAAEGSNLGLNLK
jgi:hypothetical protein